LLNRNASSWLRKCQRCRVRSREAPFMPGENQEQKPCACTQGLLDMMRAAPTKRDWLRKTICPACKKEYWTNRETDYCFDCESRRSREAGVA
jgi:hypothetical protein